jgi:hypothetical protein
MVAGPALPPPAAPTGIAAQPPCAPGHCNHRGYFHRQACKRRLQEKFLGFPEEFVRPPLGSALYATMQTQVNNGTATRMTLYDYDFVPGSGQLSLKGRDQLAKIAAQLPGTFYPVVIERIPADPALEQARRLAVIAELGRGPFAVPAERVIVGMPQAVGLRGVEADLIGQGLLMRTAAGGPPLGSGAFAGGFVGASQTITVLGGR